MDNQSISSIKNFANPKQFLPGNFIHEVARGAIHEAVIKRLGPNFPNANQIASQITNKILRTPKISKQLDKLQRRIDIQGVVTFADLEHDIIDWVPAYGPAILDAADVAEEAGMTGMNLMTEAETLKASKRAIDQAMRSRRAGKTKRIRQKRRRKTRRRH